MIHLPSMVALMTMGLSPAIAAQDRSEASYWYMKAASELESRLTFEERQALHAFAWEPGFMSTAEASALLAKVGPALSAMERGTLARRYEPTVDYSAGPHMLIPHAAPMVYLTSVLRADAIVSMQNGDAHSAMQPLTGMLRMTEQLATEGLGATSWIGSLVAGGTSDLINKGIEGGSFDSGQCAAMLTAVDRLGADPGGIQNAIAIEAEIFLAWTEDSHSTVQGRDQLNELAERFKELHPGVAYGQIASLTLNDRAGASAEVDRYISDINRAFAESDADRAKAMIDQIEQDQKSGAYGPVISALATLGQYSTLSEKHAQFLEVSAKVAQVRERLREIAGGEAAAPSAEDNAAYWISLAIQAWSELPLEDREMLQHRSDNLRRVSPEGARESFESVKAFLRNAAHSQSANFDAVFGNRDAVVPPFLIEFQPIANALIYELEVSRTGDDTETILDSLGILVGVASHLGTDDRLICSRAAEDLAAAVVPYLSVVSVGAQPAVRDDTLGLPDVIAFFRRIPPADPFGFSAAETAARSRAAVQWSLLPGVQESGHPFERAVERIASLDVDSLFVIEIALADPSNGGEDNIVNSAAGLPILLGEDVASKLLLLIEPIKIWLRDTNVAAIQQTGIAEVLDFSERAQRARATWRDLRGRLMSSHEE